MDRARQIEMVVRAASAGSFAKAATSLNLTPSAVSHAIADLEKELRVTLFYRTTRQIKLTGDGEDFCRRGREILEKLSELDAAASNSRTRLKGTLRVGISVPVARHIIMPRLPDFMRQHPELSIECTQMINPSQMQAGGVDVMLYVGEPPDSNLIARKLCQVCFAVYASPAYLKSAGEPIHPRELGQRRCLIFNPVGWASKPLDTWEFQRGKERESVKVQTALVSTEREGLISAALAGGGLIRIGLFDPTLIASGQLKRVLGGWTCGGGPPIHVLYRKSSHLPGRVAAFLDFTEEAVAAFDPEELTMIHYGRERLPRRAR